jgi:E3 ubiquitin-protein ligase MARCH6
VSQDQNDASLEVTALEALFTHPSIRTISTDIVAGQIIATIIVVAFVAIFLLREWITQNARPGVFDEGDGPADVAAIPEVVLPPAPVPLPPAQHIVPPPPDSDRHNIGIPVIPSDTTVDAFPDPDESHSGREEWPRMDSDTDEEDPEVSYTSRDKGKQPLYSLEARSDIGSSSGVKRRHSWNDAYGGIASSSEDATLALDSDQQKFTFRAPVPPRDEAIDENRVPDGWKLDFSKWNPLDNMPQDQNITPATNNDSPRQQSSGKVNGRPPLFSTVLFSPAESGSPHQMLARPSRGNTPLASPSLATYRAPEEFEAGPSNTGYFPQYGNVVDSQPSQPGDLLEEDWDIFFRDPSPVNSPHPSANESGVPVDVDEGDQSGDIEMPGLQLWTDEEELDDDEEEDGPDALVDFDAPRADLRLDEDEQLGEAREPGMAAGQGAGDDNIELAELADELDAGVEDDMEGALEGKLSHDLNGYAYELSIDILAAIGLRGPIFGVIQNVSLQ